jgi:hypothetical protein
MNSQAENVYPAFSSQHDMFESAPGDKMDQTIEVQGPQADYKISQRPNINQINTKRGHSRNTKKITLTLLPLVQRKRIKITDLKRTVTTVDLATDL